MWDKAESNLVNCLQEKFNHQGWDWATIWWFSICFRSVLTIDSIWWTKQFVQFVLFCRIYFQFLKNIHNVKATNWSWGLTTKTNKCLTAATFLTDTSLVMGCMWMHRVSRNNHCFILFTNHLLWLVSYTCPSLSMWKLSHNSFFIHFWCQC